MHGDEAKYMMEAYETNWMSTVGQNINEVERQMAEYIGVKYAVALSAGTAALHLATKLAGEKLYGQPRPNEGTLRKKSILCSDCTFDASINPVAYAANTSFVPAAVIRFGQMELALSNTVSAELLSHLKGLMQLAE